MTSETLYRFSVRPRAYLDYVGVFLLVGMIAVGVLVAMPGIGTAAAVLLAAPATLAGLAVAMWRARRWHLLLTDSSIEIRRGAHVWRLDREELGRVLFTQYSRGHDMMILWKKGNDTGNCVKLRRLRRKDANYVVQVIGSWGANPKVADHAIRTAESRKWVP